MLCYVISYDILLHDVMWCDLWWYGKSGNLSQNHTVEHPYHFSFLYYFPIFLKQIACVYRTKVLWEDKCLWSMCAFTFINPICICVYVCMYVCVCLYVWVCVCVVVVCVCMCVCAPTLTLSVCAFVCVVLELLLSSWVWRKRKMELRVSSIWPHSLRLTVWFTVSFLMNALFSLCLFFRNSSTPQFCSFWLLVCNFCHIALCYDSWHLILSYIKTINCTIFCFHGII